MSDVPALRLEELSIDYSVKGIDRRVLHHLDLSIARGESYGLVGESGCGKSTAAYAVLRYLPRNGAVSSGRVLIDGHDVYALEADELREVRRKSVAVVYQDPGRALNPAMRIGQQVAEVFELAGLPRQEWNGAVMAILAKVRIRDPERVMQRYPHQLSGGMQQRVAIAMALASDPALLILDEPTTGLDATVEADVLDLIAQLRRELSSSILFISHNLAVIAKMCDRVGVLYAGRLVEEGPVKEIFRSPLHPYTAGLLRCLPQRDRTKAAGQLATIPGFPPTPGAEHMGCAFAPRCGLADDRCRSSEPGISRQGTHAVKCHHHDLLANLQYAVPASAKIAAAGVPVLELQDVSCTFGSGAHAVRAVSGVSLTLRSGETLGLVGESGCGKTTLARCALGLTAPDAGSIIRIDGVTASPQLAARTPAQVKALQIVFQNPDSALNRSHTVRRMIDRTLSRLLGIDKSARANRIAALANAVKLRDIHLDSRPSQLSGGLKQRVAIARAFAGEPRVVICDEPTSALDVSVQAAILNLLVDLQAERQASYVFISHDLGVIRYIADRTAVLYLGEIVEIGSTEDVFNGPHHPYTEALISAVPAIDGQKKERVRLSGEIPPSSPQQAGCVFHGRCHRRIGGICETERPPSRELAGGHIVRCHLPPEQLPRS